MSLTIEYNPHTKAWTITTERGLVLTTTADEMRAMEALASVLEATRNAAVGIHD